MTYDQEALSRALGLLVNTLLSTNSPIPLTPPVAADLSADGRRIASKGEGDRGTGHRRIVDKKSVYLFALERGQGWAWHAEVSIGSVACVHRSS